MKRRMYGAYINDEVIKLFVEFSESRPGKRWEHLEEVIKAGTKALKKK